MRAFLTNMLVGGVLPLACWWARKQESTILRKGVPLTTGLLEDARRLGIAHPDRVRLLAVDSIPWPCRPLARLAQQFNLLTPDTIGVTLRYGIFIRSDFWGERRLVVHELAHTAQYERFGGIRPFLACYLKECVTTGYPFGELEMEAKRFEAELCG